MAANMPSHADPVSCATPKPATAPMIIMPSTPRLRTPERSTTSSPMAAISKGVAAVSGSAADPSVLIQAHIAHAAMLVIATPDPLGVRQMADTARALNPNIEIVLRTHSEAESQMLRDDGIGKVFFGEEELAKGMTHHVLERFAPQPGDAAQSGHSIAS